jgi:prepilin-type processing-associated H-X9-DG protein
MNRNPPEKGFTRVDLAAAVLAVCLVALSLLPAFARSGIGTKALQCLNNHRQLVNAWRMYADDNRDLLVYASLGGTASQLDRYAWASSQMDYNPNNRGNWDITYDLVKRPLWPYSGRNAAVYKCPADTSCVTTDGVTPKPRIRSAVMNTYLGGFAGTDGGWPFASPYRIYLKSSEFGAVAGPPNKIFVFTDARPDAVGWSDFLTDMTGYDPANPAAWQFQDWPGFNHDGSSSFSFVDGHCEPRQWQDPRTTPTLGPTPSGGYLASPRNPDVGWLQDHATRRK